MDDLFPSVVLRTFRFSRGEGLYWVLRSSVQGHVVGSDVSPGPESNRTDTMSRDRGRLPELDAETIDLMFEVSHLEQVLVPAVVTPDARVVLSVGSAPEFVDDPRAYGISYSEVPLRDLLSKVLSSTVELPLQGPPLRYNFLIVGGPVDLPPSLHCLLALSLAVQFAQLSGTSRTSLGRPLGAHPCAG
jgi:hypothetical protein